MFTVLPQSEWRVSPFAFQQTALCKHLGNHRRMEADISKNQCMCFMNAPAQDFLPPRHLSRLTTGWQERRTSVITPTAPPTHTQTRAPLLPSPPTSPYCTMPSFLSNKLKQNLWDPSLSCWKCPVPETTDTAPLLEVSEISLLGVFKMLHTDLGCVVAMCMCV